MSPRSFSRQDYRIYDGKSERLFSASLSGNRKGCLKKTAELLNFWVTLKCREVMISKQGGLDSPRYIHANEIKVVPLGTKAEHQSRDRYDVEIS